MLQAVLFDLYGTLIDVATEEHDAAVHAVLARFLSYLGVRADGEVLKAAYFTDIERAIAESGEAHPEVDITAIFEGIMTRFGGRAYERRAVLDTCVLFRTLTIRRLALFPGAADALAFVRGRYACGCVTDAQWAFTEPEMTMLGLGGIFGTVVMSSRLGFRKPDPRMFFRALADLGVQPAASVYIGDSPERDLSGARAAGMRCILFRGGGAEYDGPRPDATFHDYSELPGIIERMAREVILPPPSTRSPS